MGKKKEYREGWLEFICDATNYTKHEKELSKYLKRYDCLLVGVVAKGKSSLSLYYYYPKLLTRDYNTWNVDRRFLHGRYWPQEYYQQKPWDLMSAEEKREDQSLVGRVLTQRGREDGNVKEASVVFVISRVPHKDEKRIPAYNCWEVDIESWDDGDTTISCGKRRYISRELREWGENDLSFLVLHGAPRQIIVDQIKKQRSKAQKQVSNWDKMLKQAEEI